MSGPETRLLATVQGALADRPGALPAARTLSHVGEHALGWMAIGAAGAALDRDRSEDWAAVAAGAFTAHAVSVVLKRVVRRRRPDDPSVAVHVGTPSKLSFPSSHASSTTAAAVLLADVTGARVIPVLLVPSMLASRLVLGVHYPSDVAAGAALGWGTAAAVRAVRTTGVVRRFVPRTTAKEPR